MYLEYQYICTHVYVYICMYIYIFIYVYIYIPTYIHIYVHIYIHIHINIYISIYIYICIHIYIYLCYHSLCFFCCRVLDVLTFFAPAPQPLMRRCWRRHILYRCSAVADVADRCHHVAYSRSIVAGAGRCCYKNSLYIVIAVIDAPARYFIWDATWNNKISQPREQWRTNPFLRDA